MSPLTPQEKKLTWGLCVAQYRCGYTADGDGGGAITPPFLD